MSRPPRKFYPLQHPFEQISWLCAEESFRRCRPVGAFHKIVVNRRERLQFLIANPMQAVMAQRQMPVSPFYAGTGSLEKVGTIQGDLFDEHFVFFFKAFKRSVSGQKRSKNVL